jgi:hypothetical protein
MNSGTEYNSRCKVKLDLDMEQEALQALLMPHRNQSMRIHKDSHYSNRLLRDSTNMQTSSIKVNNIPVQAYINFSTLP